jgi:hypothetical protein
MFSTCRQQQKNITMVGRVLQEADQQAAMTVAPQLTQ